MILTLALEDLIKLSMVGHVPRDSDLIVQCVYVGGGKGILVLC